MLTVAQFNARMKDVGEINSVFHGEGKGRIKRDAKIIAERRIGKSIIPASISEGQAKNVVKGGRYKK